MNEFGIWGWVCHWLFGKNCRVTKQILKQWGGEGGGGVEITAMCLCARVLLFNTFIYRSCFCSLFLFVYLFYLFTFIFIYSGQVKVFNVHIQSKLLLRTPVTGTSTGLCQFLCPGQDLFIFVFMYVLIYFVAMVTTTGWPTYV